MKLVNLTPHDVVIVDEDGTPILTVPSTGLARCKATTVRIGTIEVETEHGIVMVPETTTSFGDVYGLPEPENNTLYIVSRLVVEATHRVDLRIPNETVRDENGRIYGCLSIGRI